MKTKNKHSLLAAIVLPWLLPLASAAQVTNTVTVDVRDWEDGRDQLILSGNTVQWQHFDHNIPGIEAENEDPTWITTTCNGLTILDSYPWYPSWTNATVSGTFSSSFTNLLPSLPALTLVNFQMQTVSARDTMTLIQAPSPTNAYTTIVEFNDDASLGADYYEVLLSYSFIAASPRRHAWRLVRMPGC